MSPQSDDDDDDDDDHDDHDDDDDKLVERLSIHVQAMLKPQA